MRKNCHIWILIVSAVILAAVLFPVPLSGAANDDLNEDEPTIIDNLLKPLLSVAPPIKLFWPWLAGAVLVSAFLKAWILRRRLALPGRFAVMDKLMVASVSEILAELVFLFVLILLFAPMLLEKLDQHQWLTAAADPAKGQPWRFIVLAAFNLPYIVIIGAGMTLLALHLLTHKSSGQLRPLLRVAVSASLIFPILLILTIWVSQFFLKLPTETPPVS